MRGDRGNIFLITKDVSLLLFAPSVTNQFNGHHFPYSISLAEAAKEFFDHVSILVNRDYRGISSDLLQPVLKEPFAKKIVVAIWRPSISYVPPVSGEERLESVPKPLSLLHRCWRHLKGPYLVLGYSLNIHKTLRKTSARNIHVFVEDTMFWEIVALPLLTILGRRQSPVTWHLLLRYPPEMFAQGFRSLSDLRCRIRKLCHRKNPVIFFYTDTSQLTDAYRSFIGCQEQFMTVPVPPIQGMFAEKDSARIPRHAESVLRLGYMGGPRLDKGFNTLPWLYERLPARLFGLEIEMIIQIGPVTDRAAVAVVQTLTSFPYDPKRPKLVFFPEFDSKSYCAVFAGLDIVLILYTDYRYRFSSSGIFVEAVQYGKPVLTFAGSWVAGLIDTAARDGLSIGLAINKLSEVPTALERMAGEIERYKKDMETFRKGWLPEQNIRRIAQMIAGRAGLIPVQEKVKK
jgi:hypothetical protein